MSTRERTTRESLWKQNAGLDQQWRLDCEDAIPPVPNGQGDLLGDGAQVRPARQGPIRALYAQIVNLRASVISLVVVAAGVLLLLWQGTLEGFWNDFIGSLGTALIPVGLIGFVYEIWLRRSFIGEFLAAAQLREDLASTGIREITFWSRIDWRAFFDENPGDVEVCFSYGRTWSNTHAEHVLRVASSAGHRVRVSLLDPTGPKPFLAFYGEEYGTDAEGLKERIEEVLKTWKEAANRVSSEGLNVKLEIEGVHRPVPYSFYKSGRSMWCVLHRREKARVTEMPALKCEAVTSDESLFQWILNDMESCRRDNLTRIIKEVGDGDV